MVVKRVRLETSIRKREREKERERERERQGRDLFPRRSGAFGYLEAAAFYLFCYKVSLLRPVSIVLWKRQKQLFLMSRQGGVSGGGEESHFELAILTQIN